MAKTSVLPTDAGAVKLWSAKVAIDTANKMYWGKLTGSEADALPVVNKTDLESGPGDEVTSYLIAKFRGKPIEGSEKGEGREDKLTSYTHAMRIDKLRKLVNVGDIMTQKRTPYSIGEQVRNRLTDYLAEVGDQLITMYASGARGTGAEITHYPTSWTGFPNALVAPDADHLFIAGAGTKIGLTTGDKMGTDVIDRVLVKTKQMYGGPGAAVRMTPVTVSGGTPSDQPGKHFLFLLGTEPMYDLRREVGDAGWLTLEKAKTSQDGAKNPIFMGGAAYYNGALVDDVQHYVKFTDYGAGSNVPAARSLMVGAHAVASAYGMKGRTMRWDMLDSDVDHHEEEVVIARTICGYSKTRHNSMDFGVIAVDTAFTAL